MPRRRRAKGRRRRRRNTSRGLPPASRVPRLDLSAILASAKPPVETKDGWLVLPKREEKASPKPMVELPLLRHLFPRDTPFQTFLSLQGDVATNASGVMNFQQPVTGVSSTAEWSSVNALFDEFYVHEMRLHYNAFNKHGSVGVSSTAAANPYAQVTTTNTTTDALSAGAVVTAIQGPPAYYTTAAAMANNPAAEVHHTGDDWIYVWRNTVRFDPHGMTFSATTSTNGWQGWAYIADAAQYGGAVQMRATNDQVLGGGGSTIHTGTYLLRFVVSFRSRA